MLYPPPPREASRADRPIKPDANIDPATFPIIARHFFDIVPPRPIGQIAAQVIVEIAERPERETVSALVEQLEAGAP